jgi:RimJ/RimL family protein N-acetyltransferase
MSFIIRAARDRDLKAIYDISNDAEVRARSLNSAAIKWEEHVEWFKKKLNDTHHVFYVAVDEAGEVAGQVRYQVDTETAVAVVAISLRAGRRGQGLGRLFIEQCDSRLFTERPEVQRILASVRIDNEASSRTFVKADYRIVEDHHVEPTGIVVRVYEKLREANGS